MAQNHRNQSGRSDFGRGGRYQSGGDRDRYRTGGEHRYSPSWDDRDSRGYEGERSYSAGGYSEEFGYRRDQNRDERDRDYRDSNYQSRGSSGANYQREQGGSRDYWGGSSRGGVSRYEPSRYEEGRFDEQNRWSAGEGRDDSDEFYSPYERDRGTTTSSWHEDQGDRGGYFNTGSYIDDGGASRGFGADFERARAETQRRFGSQGNTGDYSNYGRSMYGSQSGYGRGRDEQRTPGHGRNRGYEERSSWGYGRDRGQRAGSGSTSGGYGGDSGYRSDYGSYAGSQQSHRGRGPQGYQRSDERLKEMICERLTDDPAIDATNVSVEVTSQVVKLTGTVDDRSTKYEIEELVESLGGVKDIDNQLRVQSSQSNRSSTNQTQSSGQQLRGGSDWEAGSSNVSTSGTTKTSGTSPGTSTSNPSASPSKRN
jgi:osmotically-inducible protein OsmY